MCCIAYVCILWHLFWNLTHWSRVTHICVGKVTNIGSDNGLSPGWRQAIFGTNAGILLIGPLGTNFSEKFNRNSNICIHENATESVVCDKVAILSRPQGVKLQYRDFATSPIMLITNKSFWFISLDTMPSTRWLTTDQLSVSVSTTYITMIYRCYKIVGKRHNSPWMQVEIAL